jgi:ferrous iron transport protein B
MNIALAGNPNTGKSSIFNALTGSRQHVGNWPGKTVTRHGGSYSYDGDAYDVVDLPGTYSLNAISPEEVIARDHLLSGETDVVVVVLDAANLERNLYLATQILEMEVPAVVALNMVDVAVRRGEHIDIADLSEVLGVTVVPTVARTKEGLDQLRSAIAAQTATTGAS